MKSLIISSLVIILLILPEFSHAASNDHQIVLYWGQNTARRNEKPLEFFCTTGHYDVIVLNYVTHFFAAQTRYPSLNLALHCGPVALEKSYPGIYKCPDVANAIKLCQSRGIKIMIGLRSEAGPKWLHKSGDGKELAGKIWNLFLGGKDKRRPFGDAVLNGINLSIRTGNDLHLDEMFAEFNRLYATDSLRQYQSTLTVACDSTSLNVLQLSAPVLDGVFLQNSYGSACHLSGDEFQESLKEWTLILERVNRDIRRNLKFYPVVVMSEDVGAYVTPYKDFYGIYQETLKNHPLFEGVVLDDAGWDDYQAVLPQNKRYSTILFTLFGRSPRPTLNTLNTKSSSGVTTKTKIPANKEAEGPQVGAFWGSNLAEGTTGNTEKSLFALCRETPYKTIVLNTLDEDEDDQNKGNLPGLNFAKHCHQTFGTGYKSYLKCPNMEKDIKFCQSQGVKIILSIGGSTRFIGFPTPQKAQQFARTLWKLFLGGVQEAKKESLPRTFGSVVLDGINIEVRFGDRANFVDFVRELRRLMDEGATPAQKFLITANPSCIHPSYILHETFQQAIGAFDHLFVNFDDQNCNVNRAEKFEPAFQTWYDYAIKPNGPQIWVGLPADPRKTANKLWYLKSEEAKQKLEFLSSLYRKFGGIMLNDASWDYENKQKDGSMYSHAISNILSGNAQTPTPQGNDEKTSKPVKPIVRTINGKPVLASRGAAKRSSVALSLYTLLMICVFVTRIVL